MIAAYRPIPTRQQTSPSSQLPPNAALRRGAALFATAALLAVPTSGPAAQATANITLSPATYSFRVIDSAQQYMASSSITVGGTLTTKNSGGSIVMLAPGNITGPGGGVMKISYFSITCSGAAAAGQSFLANKTPLVASSSVGCATYGTGFDSTRLPGGQLNFTMSLFLDDRTLDNDSYPASNFTVVATAT